MSLSRSLAVYILVSGVLWIGAQVLPAAVQLIFGRATGIVVAAPGALRGLPSWLQIATVLFGPPLVAGSVIGFFVYWISNR